MVLREKDPYDDGSRTGKMQLVKHQSYQPVGRSLDLVVDDDDVTRAADELVGLLTAPRPSPVHGPAHTPRI